MANSPPALRASPHFRLPGTGYGMGRRAKMGGVKGMLRVLLQQYRQEGDLLEPIDHSEGVQERSFLAVTVVQG
jgi:hypothetical protein